MPTCQNCGSKWSWNDSFKKLASFRKNMKCNDCGANQYQSMYSRKITSIVVLFPLITIPITVLFNLSLTFVIIIELVLMLVVLLSMPLFLQLTDKEEPLW
ncbi:hypothetical protein F7984_09535 [Pradoshia sp. D12]|uniref:TIGR04104 family putative zinc finger protein n=1 Tax=Bacillaceae TaxID=186817 RepID=UPI0011215569|nr:MULTISPECIES: TIGR04104 family putative zinc finger protein [Bacillaceae]QFK71460.1 hypothetical protein F7984_09535 [Pradoshia sp. D12]TPF73255.1 hypothetical protein FHY44_05930 [Bacillus sp. D12]